MIGKNDPEARPRFRALWLLIMVAGLGALCVVGVFLYQSVSRYAPASPETSWSRLAGELPVAEMNVILVTIDTLRADRLGCYGNPSVETPHLDQLAREGIRFSNAASTVPFTLPAHSSLMTGTYPPHHGVRENVGYVLDPRFPTLAERLANGGWDTAGFVSAFVLDSRWGISRGFDTYFDDFDLGESQRANLGSVQRDGAETVAEAVRWLDGERTGPFFMWLHLFDPHDPYTPPEPFRSRYPGNPYNAEVAYTDSLIGRFRAELEDRNLLDSSLVIVTGDHGEGLGQHREGFHGFFIYDSTIHVPLIVRPPFPDLAGTTIDEAVSHVDLLPTVLEATAQPIPEGVQGASLIPLLLGHGSAEEERAVYSESLYPLLHYGWAPLRSIRTRRFKYIASPRPELYDVAADTAEESNILLRERRTSRQMRTRLDAMRQLIEAEEAASAGRADLDEETMRQLMALGYVAGRGGVSEDEEAAAPRADPKDRIELHQLVMAAQSDLGAENFDRAQQRLEDALTVDPTMVEAHQMLGTVSAQRGRHEEAIQYFQAALALRDDLETSLFGLARAYQELGKLDEAMVGYRRLLELEPDDTKAHVALADVHVLRGRVDLALAELEGAAERPEPAPVVLNRLGELLVEAGRLDEAEAQFRRVVEQDGEFAQPFFNLAVLREERGDLEEAARLYEEAVRRAPTHYQAQFNLGRLYGRRGDFDRQRQLYEAALESNPEFVRGYFFLAKLLMDLNEDLPRAEELARIGLDKDAENRTGALGYYVLADLLNRRGRHQEAAQAAAEGQRIQAAE